jgi:hypothetical protein
VRLGVCSDIHGNRHALEGVLADGEGITPWRPEDDRRVAYDHDAFLGRVAASGHPEHDHIASYQRGDPCRFPSSRPGAPSWND